MSVAVSLGAGVGTLALVYLWRLDAARVTAALAVAALLGGWALAANPVLLEGLTVEQAAAPANLLIPLVIAIVAGGLVDRRWPRPRERPGRPAAVTQGGCWCSRLRIAVTRSLELSLLLLLPR